MADFRPFCVKCSIRMNCVKNQVYLVHKNDFVQESDLYECPNCQTQILTGYGQPILALGKDRKYVERFSQQEQKEDVFFEIRTEVV